MIASGDRIKTMDIDTIYRLSRDRLITIGIRINTANSTYAIAKPRNLSIAGRIPFTLQSSANAKGASQPLTERPKRARLPLET